MIKEAFLLSKTSLFDSISQMNAGANVPSVDSSTDVFQQLGEVVNYFLGVVGLVMLILVIYAGVTMLISQGNDDKVTEARKMIVYGIIGTVLIALAYALTSWIFSSGFFGGTGIEGGGGTDGGGTTSEEEEGVQWVDNSKPQNLDPGTQKGTPFPSA